MFGSITKVLGFVALVQVKKKIIHEKQPSKTSRVDFSSTIYVFFSLVSLLFLFHSKFHTHRLLMHKLPEPLRIPRYLLVQAGFKQPRSIKFQAVMLRQTHQPRYVRCSIRLGDFCYVFIDDLWSSLFLFPIRYAVVSLPVRHRINCTHAFKHARVMCKWAVNNTP